MTLGMRRPWEAVSYDALVRHVPPPPDYFESLFFASPEELDRLKLTRLQHRARQAMRIPFFARRWEKAAVSAEDLRSLDDLWRFPLYDVDDIRRSVETNPPFGDYQGVSLGDINREPLRIYMSGGTTGKSRPTLYTQWDREASAILAARTLHRQGVRPGDVVINSYQYSTFNGGALFDEAFHRWMGCLVIPASSSTVTSNEKQVEMAVEYGASVIYTTADHLMRLATTAEEMGYEIGRDLKLRVLGGLGDRKSPEAIRAILDRFGIPEFYETYGFHEIGMAAVECPEHDGLHVFEDALTIQIVDPDSGEPLPDGEMGSMVVTEYFKTGSAQFRYNTLDLSFLYPAAQCRCGSWMRRIGPFSGRGDNMVKLRGINVWPEAVGGIAAEVPGLTTDYFVRARRVGERDDMGISVV
jgi:phenylacetate-CoA ligase